jgi:hypothetical protein
VDASATWNDANSEVAGINILIHLSYVYPTDESIHETTTDKKQFAPQAMANAFMVNSIQGNRQSTTWKMLNRLHD